MAVRIQGSGGSNVAAVDANGSLQVKLASGKANAGAATIFGDLDGYGVSVPSSRRLLVGQDQVCLWEPALGSTLNGFRWTAPVTTATVVQGSGFISLNAANSTSANAVARITSVGQFDQRSGDVLEFSARVRTTNLGIANTVADFGFVTHSGTSIASDGVFFRVASNGEMRAVMSYSGTEVQSPLALAVPSSGDVHVFRITVFQDDAHFFVDGVEVADLSVPNNFPAPQSGRNPVSFRVYCGGSAPALPPKLDISQVSVRYLGGNAEPLVDAMGRNARHSFILPTTGLTAINTTTGTGNQTMTNNTAPAVGTVGGHFNFAATAGAVNEYPMFAYQVPTGYRMLVHGVRIHTVNLGAVVATTPTVLQWAIASGCTASSLATTDTADFSGLAPRRLQLGTQCLPLAAVIGYEAAPVDVKLSTPMVVDSGRYFHVVLCTPVGTATGSQVIRGCVYVDAHLE